MPTPAQIDKQIALEREAIRCGIDKLYKGERKAAEREYSSSSVHGTASIKAAQEHVAAAIMDTFLNAVKKNKNGQHYAEIKHHLIQFYDERESNILANIALKRTFDLVFSQKRKGSKKHPNSVANVTVSIGQAVEAECQMRYYESKDPELFKRISRKYWKATTGTDQKRSVMSIMMNRNDYHWDNWSGPLRARLGAWLLDLVATTTGWFQKESKWLGKNNSVKLVTPTDLYLQIQSELLGVAEMFAPLAYPMLIEPNDWTNDRAGGYLLNEVMRGHDMVRRGNPTLRQPDAPLKFLNRLQKVAYQINPFTLEVAEQLDAKGYKIGKFKPRSYLANWVHPNPPVDIETNADARFQYRKDKTESENSKKLFERSIHVRTTATLELAKKFADKDKFYLPWSFDYRGRAYPIPAYLTPHDTDFGKSLLRFAQSSFMTVEAEDWLKFQLATTYGLDKATMQDRIQWVNENTELITKVATDPISHIHEWENVDEPWQFLASCDEYYHCCIACDRDFTSLPVAVDATCSGLQILAGLARDAGTAKLVNVLPSESPQDAYKTVLNAMEDIPERLKPFCDRSTTKRSVMTLPYNATIQSSRDYIKEALIKKMPKDMDPPTPQEITILAKSLRAAMDKIAPGPLRVMDWIGKEMSAAIKRGNDVVRWVTPSGFQVEQKRNKYETERLDLKLMGTCKFSIVSGEKGPDPRKHKSSGAPNLIHS